MAQQTIIHVLRHDTWTDTRTHNQLCALGEDSMYVLIIPHHASSTISIVI